MDCLSAVSRAARLGSAFALSAAAGWLATAASTAWAQAGPDDRLMQLLQSIQWQEGASEAAIGTTATITLPAGYRLTGPQGSQIWNQINHNPPNGTEATLMPSDELSWFLVFEFADIGYVKDDEKANLDADKILETIKAGTEQFNVYRRSQGWAAVHFDRWLYPPGYDEQTHNLYWATLLRSDDGRQNANYSTRLLGRRGVMHVTLVCDQNEMATVVPKVKELLAGFKFNSGEKYAEWKSGDKLAQYGLTGLITGGAAVAAAKTGLLAKLGVLLAKGGKAIVVGIAALVGGIWKFLTGRRSNSAS